MSDITYEDRVTLAKLCGKTLSDKWHSPGLVYIEGVSGSAPIVWQPDVDLNQTFECVEAAAEKHDIEITVVRSVFSGHKYHAKTFDTQCWGRGAGKPAVAICRAILEAMTDEA